MSEQTSTTEGAAPGEQQAGPSAKRTLVGQVVSDKMDKTTTALVERRVKHLVSIEPCRPLSKSKSWRLHEILERAR